MKSWIQVASATVVIAALACACSRGSAGDTIDGQALFQSLCATCHGADGRPPASMAARLGVRDLTAAEFRARVSPALVEQQVRAGSTSRLMPSFQGLLSDAQIAAVSAFVASPQFVSPR